MITSIIPIIKNLFFCIHFLFISYYYYYYLNQSKSILFKIETKQKISYLFFFLFCFRTKKPCQCLSDKYYKVDECLWNLLSERAEKI
jgi:hypothetical protein